MESLRLRLVLAGRAGKKVTVVTGFTREPALMEKLASQLKRSLGCGGSWRQGAIELQGDERARVRSLLVAKGFTLRG